MRFDGTGKLTRRGIHGEGVGVVDAIRGGPARDVDGAEVVGPTASIDLGFLAEIVEGSGDVPKSAPTHTWKPERRLFLF